MYVGRGVGHTVASPGQQNPLTDFMRFEFHLAAVGRVRLGVLSAFDESGDCSQSVAALDALPDLKTKVFRLVGPAIEPFHALMFTFPLSTSANHMSFTGYKFVSYYLTVWVENPSRGPNSRTARG